MPRSSKPQDAASTRELERGHRHIRTKAQACSNSREPGRMPGSKSSIAIGPVPTPSRRHFFLIICPIQTLIARRARVPFAARV